MGIENITYRVYTIRELNEWLICNKQNGLSEYCIAPTRAYAFVNNPCAREDDPAIVVAFNEQKAIGFSAAFADKYVSGHTIGRFYWGSTEWLEPKYRGKGIAGKMMRTLKEVTGIERYIGLESSIASVKLDQKQGANIELYNKTKFYLSSKGTLKKYLMTKYTEYHNAKQLNKLNDYVFQNEYVNFVDAETYRFIEAHSQKDLFLRQRKMLNWILRYPFLIATNDDVHAKNDICEFGSTVSKYTVEAIKVYVNENLGGFYMVSQTNQDRTLRYLYYDDAYRNEVFASVTLNLMKPGIERIYFMSAELPEFMHQHGIKHLNRKSYIEKVALTLPPDMSVNKNLHVQGGDGDMFC